LVTGRPSGWGECWARNLPVDGVIAENGGLYFTRRRGRWVKVFAQGLAQRRRARQALLRNVERVLQTVRGARLSMDSVATEVDIAFDLAEGAPVAAGVADQIERLMRARGATAVRSSVHINCWMGEFDKLHTARAFVRREWGLSFPRAQRHFVFVGDSYNDAPMFEGFTRSVGVANVRRVLAELPVPPAWITRQSEGAGFEELVRAVLRGRRA